MECPLCGGKAKIYGVSRKGSVRDITGSITYYRCRNCGLVFQENAVSLNRDELYAYYQGEMPWQRFRMRRLQEAFLSWPTNSFYLSFIKQYAPGAKSIFDLGCGTGQLLFQARCAGYDEVGGIEYSEKSERFAREVFEIPITVGDICEAVIERKYDIVTIFQTIEHLSNPKQVLNKVREILNSNGKLIIGTPDVDSVMSKLWKMKWHHINIHHICLYNGKSLAKLLQEAGFRVIKVQRRALYSSNWLKSYIYYSLGFLLALFRGRALPKDSSVDGMIVVAEKA